jgi:hypothetical protein
LGAVKHLIFWLIFFNDDEKCNKYFSLYLACVSFHLNYSKVAVSFQTVICPNSNIFYEKN